MVTNEQVAAGGCINMERRWIGGSFEILFVKEAAVFPERYVFWKDDKDFRIIPTSWHSMHTYISQNIILNSN